MPAPACRLLIMFVTLLLRRCRTGRWKGALVAIKVVEHTSGEGGKADVIEGARESLLAASVSHPNVVRCSSPSFRVEGSQASELRKAPVQSPARPSPTWRAGCTARLAVGETAVAMPAATRGSPPLHPMCRPPACKRRFLWVLIPTYLPHVEHLLRAPHTCCQHMAASV